MNARRTIHVFSAVLVLIALLAGPASSLSAPFDVYSSFGAGNSYNTHTLWGVSGASTSGGYRGQAQFFVPDTSGDLNSIELATYYVSGSDLSNFYIAQDNGSGIPGTVLESWLNVANGNGLLTLSSSTQVSLQAGEEYWVCDEPATSTSDIAWYQNNQNISPGDAFDRSEWSWATIGGGVETAGVFSVALVPEPSTFALLLTGLVFLGGPFLGIKLRFRC